MAKPLRLDLGTQKISQLLLKMSLPAGVAMFVNGTYNMVDAIFVGQAVGVDALGGLGIIFPLQMLFVAIGGLLGTGAASIVSRNLGSGNSEKAFSAAGNALSSAACIGLLITLLIAIFLNPILRIFGAINGTNIYLKAKEYLSVILFAPTFTFISMTGNNLARSEGNARMAMISMIIGALTNILLDAIFIFIFKMGVTGAAIATVLSAMLSSTILLIYFFVSNRSHITIKLHHLKFKIFILREIIVIGSGTFFRQVGVSALATVMNNILGHYGAGLPLKDLSGIKPFIEDTSSLYIAIYGVIAKLTSFIMMPLFGIVQGFQPIVGFNYGAGNPKRVREAIKLSIISSIIISSTMFIIVMIFSKFAISLFSKDVNLIFYGQKPLRFFIMLLPVVNIILIASGLFQSIGKAIPSLFLALSRQVIFLIPLILLFSMLFGLEGIWWSFPIADFISIIASILWVRFELKTPQMIVTNTN